MEHFRRSFKSAKEQGRKTKGNGLKRWEGNKERKYFKISGQFVPFVLLQTIPTLHKHM
jgi:hypothetical protein